ncbi:hypothetical protein ACA910_004551 [Epithemia clementina (nom. ined.)]
MSKSIRQSSNNRRDDNDHDDRYDHDDDNHDIPLEERAKLRAPPDFDGPMDHGRRCTDFLCLLLLFAMWISLTGVGIHVMSEGDYRRILYPLDYDGNVCGTDLGDLDMTDYPLLYYVNSYSGGVCVQSCPSVTDALTALQQQNNKSSVVVAPVDVRTLITYAGVYQVSGAVLPKDYIQVGNYSGSKDAVACTTKLCFPNASDPTSSWNTPGIARGFGIAYYAGDTYELLFRCYYTVQAEKAISDLVVADENGFLGGIQPATEANQFLNDYLFGDIYIARKYVLGFGLGLCVAISFTYIFLMRIPMLLTSVVWGSIFATIFMFFMGGYYTYNTAQDWQEAVDAQQQNSTNTTTTTTTNDDAGDVASQKLDSITGIDNSTIKATRAAAYLLWIFGCLLILLVCCLRRQIMIAIGCVKTAGKAVNHMFALLGIPLVQALGMLAFCAVWIAYAVHLASLGDITVTEIDLPNSNGAQIAFREYEWSPFVQRCGWFLLFCLFWTANFIVAMGDLMIALSVAKYYFTRDKWKIGSWSVLVSVWQVIWYHAGTCAYGSLLIASVQVIRVAIAKAQRTAKKANNKFAQCILCCCQCCFAMMEKCLKFISKHAYIQTAIFSTAFCKSCRKGYYLIARNVYRIAAISYVSSAVLIIGKLFIASITTLLGYYAINENLIDELHSTAGPTIFIFLLSYWVSDFFMDVFDMAITAVLHCFIADEEMFSDNVYADPDLKKYINDHGSPAKEES